MTWPASVWYGDATKLSAVSCSLVIEAGVEPVGVTMFGARSMLTT